MKKSPFFFLLVTYFFLPLSGNMLLAQEEQTDWFENHHQSKYFISPTGFGLKKGEKYYQNIYSIYNSVGFGITDNFSINAGIIPFSLVGFDGLLLNINPKFSIPLEDNFHVGITSSLFVFFDDLDDLNDTDSFGSVSGVITYGNTNNNISIAVGGLVADSFIVPTTTISGQFRFSKNIFIISENWISPFLISSLGIRIMLKKWSIDFAYLNTPKQDFFSDNEGNNGRSHLPFMSIQVPFGKKRKK